MTNFDWADAISQVLKSTPYMALSTSDATKPWVNPVFFSYDEDFNLYFISMLSSRHMQNIASNSHVAVAIFSTDQKPGNDVRGIQLSGSAVILADADVEPAFENYYNRVGASEAMNGQPSIKDHLGPKATWKFVKIQPSDVYFFDSEHFGEERQDVRNNLKVFL